MAGALQTVTDLAATEGRILGVDFGDTRTGLALSDPSRLLASGLETLSPGGMEKTAEAVAKVAKERDAAAVVVGLPKNMDGTEGFRAVRCREFAEKLSALTGLPVAMLDERLTTVSASR